MVIAADEDVLPRVAPGTVSLEFDSKTSIFKVLGLDGATLEAVCRLDDEKKAKVFAVFPIWKEGKGTRDAFPMIGRYQCLQGELVFRPAYPLEKGLTYKAWFHGRNAESGKPLDFAMGIELPEPELEPKTQVVAVYPSTKDIPANLLKFYIVFSGPMSLDQAMAHVRLLDRDGKVLKRPFLEVQDELWDRHHRRLTVLLDPGRIKRGLQPNLSEGPPLREGQTLTLEIDRHWLDGHGQPLMADFRKTYRVKADDRTSPKPSSWQWELPKAGSIQPLTLRFPEPMDFGLLGSGLAIVDKNERDVAGRIELGKAEYEWHFYPELPWRKGAYSLQVSPRLEDLAGNNLRRVFDRDLRKQPSSKSTRSETVVMPFNIEE